MLTRGCTTMYLSFQARHGPRLLLLVTDYLDATYLGMTLLSTLSILSTVSEDTSCDWKQGG